jgi:branched-subunit amino acid ABC-type transport system permease component
VPLHSIKTAAGESTAATGDRRCCYCRSSWIAQGCIYGLIALGFVLIYKATETVNFAQGELMMLGAFFGGWPLMTHPGLPFWLAAPAGGGRMFLLGIGWSAP